jgi:hypothetical protein
MHKKSKRPVSPIMVDKAKTDRALDRVAMRVKSYIMFATKNRGINTHNQSPVRKSANKSLFTSTKMSKAERSGSPLNLKDFKAGAE